MQRPRVPFAIAGAGPRSIDVAARHGQLWVTFGDPAGADASTDERLATVGPPAHAGGRGLRARRARSGARSTASTCRGWTPTRGSNRWRRFRDLAGRYGELGFTDLALHWPRPEPPYVSDPAVFEAILAEADRPGDLG